MVCLAWQLPASAAQRVAMASGLEVCTTSGMQIVDADGKAISAQHHECPDCCCAASPMMPAAPDRYDPAVYPRPAPIETLTMRRLAAQWLAPLSRGPPANS